MILGLGGEPLGGGASGMQGGSRLRGDGELFDQGGSFEVGWRLCTFVIIFLSVLKG
jgi:hypothetical protein